MLGRFVDDVGSLALGGMSMIVHSIGPKFSWPENVWSVLDPCEVKGDNYSSNLRVEAKYRGKFGCGVRTKLPIRASSRGSTFRCTSLVLRVSPSFILR